MEQLQFLAQVFQSASVIVAALVAIFGIDAWRREYVGKRRMDLAEEALAMFYQARDVIGSIRSSGGFGGEGQTRQAGPNESREEKVALDQAYVLIERYNKHVELFSRLHALRYRFMAQVGKEKTKPFDDLDQVLNELLLAARRLSRYWSRNERQFSSEQDREAFSKRMRESEAIYWEGEDADPIAPRVDALVAELEHTCQAILASKGTLFGLINLPVWNRSRG